MTNNCQKSNLEQRKIANDNDLFNFYMSLKPEQRIDGKIIKLSLLDTNKDLPEYFKKLL